MNAESLLGALFGLALFALAGRCLLAWLPAGEPGRHRPADLPVTLAASYLLGWIAFHTAAGAAAEVGLRFSWATFLAPFALLAVIRVATLPGAMVPRHDARPQRETVFGRLALIALLLALLLVPMQSLRAAELALPTEPGELAGWRAARPWENCVLRLARPAQLMALALLTTHGLAALDVRPFARRLAGLLVLALPACWPVDGLESGVWIDAQLALSFGAGTAFALHWFARADRRALALALLSFGACLAEAPAGVPLGAAGLAALAASLHRNALRIALPWGLLALVVVALPWRLVRMALELGDCGRTDLSSSAAWPGPALIDGLLDWRAGGPLWVLAPLAAAWVLMRSSPADRRPERFLVTLALLAALLHAALMLSQECLAELDGALWSDLFLRAAPAAAMLLALASGRARPEAERA